MRSVSYSRWFVALVVLLLLFVPQYARLAGEPFALTFVSRVLVFALAAISLNLVLGFGGMVSFGHALYMGLGAYAVGILAQHEIGNGWMQLGVTVLACAAVGAVTGLISLRTSGIAFIMITLAFAQMFYYLFVSLKQYGGDDGLSVTLRSDFGLFSLGSPVTLYYVALALVLAVLFGMYRLVGARFGMVLRGCRINERRMKAMGFMTLRYKLTAYVLASVISGVAGLLYANLTGFASPAYMAWTVSGELIVMVVLGGMGTVFGPLLGALVLLFSEEVLKTMTDHWQMVLGPLIVLVVLTARRGVYGYLLDWDGRRARRAIKAEAVR
ncbi:branched-chain amino acid ABC transporter permease [Rhodoferax koreense]|uniref:Branched-chain amino acid ABC transporter permease n=1 Tax=Rhodoferax koreensis TaxID=1842727 RepID=A0A1P8K328_9BURK|nr:branched-chain amino acid ABC transporter permease [Rhodoferax koreense]APW40420.1 branched-chain amino acid ABC transporter permease [Rhodoferax koreense]